MFKDFEEIIEKFYSDIDEFINKVEEDIKE